MELALVIRIRLLYPESSDSSQVMNLLKAGKLKTIGYFYGIKIKIPFYLCYHMIAISTLPQLTFVQWMS